MKHNRDATSIIQRYECEYACFIAEPRARGRGDSAPEPSGKPSGRSCRTHRLSNVFGGFVKRFWPNSNIGRKNLHLTFDAYVILLYTVSPAIALCSNFCRMRL